MSTRWLILIEDNVLITASTWCLYSDWRYVYPTCLPQTLSWDFHLHDQIFCNEKLNWPVWLCVCVWGGYYKSYCFYAFSERFYFAILLSKGIYLIFVHQYMPKFSWKNTFPFKWSKQLCCIGDNLIFYLLWLCCIIKWNTMSRRL